MKTTLQTDRIQIRNIEINRKTQVQTFTVIYLPVIYILIIKMYGVVLSNMKIKAMRNNNQIVKMMKKHSTWAKMYKSWTS